MMTTRETVVALFTGREDAQRATTALAEAGLPSKDMGCLRPSDALRPRNMIRGASLGSLVGGLVGVVIGGALGVIVALGSGVGSAAFEEVMVLLVSGIVTGGAAGVGVGVLLGTEFSDEPERYFIQEVESGRTLMMVRVSGDREEEVITLLRRSKALEVDKLGRATLGRRLSPPDILGRGSVRRPSLSVHVGGGPGAPTDTRVG